MSRSPALLVLWLGGLTAVAVGCQGNTPGSAGQATATSAASDHVEPDAGDKLDMLKPEDRDVAKAQKTCPVSGEPLGSMGMPVKLTLEGTPVFVCCQSCVKRAEADPAKTVKKAEELKAKK